MIAHIHATRRFWVLLLALLTACTVVEVPPPGVGRQTPAPAVGVGPSPTSTLPPDQLLARALHAHALGDYDSSGADLSSLLATYPHAPETRAARYYLAESYAQRGRWTSAVEGLRVFMADGTQDALRARAQFWLARGYESAGDGANAIAAYQAYRDLKTPLEPYAAMRQAAQQQALGQLEQAAGNYEYAAAADIDRGEQAGSYEKAIALREQLGQPDAALALYDKLLALAQEPSYRARILFEGAALARKQSQLDRARMWLREIIDKTPSTAEAADAVGLLLNDDAYQASPQALDAATAARVFFNVERYDAALPLFDAAIAAANGDDALELRRLRALTLRGQQNLQGALDELAAIGAASPDSEPGRQAQLDWIQTLGWTNQTDQAIQAYRQYATSYGGPSVAAPASAAPASAAPASAAPASAAPDPRAPEALARAAELLDRKGDTEGATQQRLDLANRYPQSEQAHEALATVAMRLYRAGRASEAQTAWQTLAQNTSADAVERAQAAFWAGTTAEGQQAHDQAYSLWQQAQTIQPDSYYGTRAADKLLAAGMPISTTTTARSLASPITESDWQGLEQWVNTAFGPRVPQVAEHADPGEVAQAGHVVRAQALAEVGLQSESVAEWMDARDEWADDPQRLLLLARLAYERDTPYIVLKAASRLVGLLPENVRPPDMLLRLLYPVPYQEFVQEQARAQGIDPLLLYALLRQESLFNPGAISGAGAYGLAQVMPETGQGIAQRLDVSDYDPTILLRPVIGIRFGAFYIAQQIKSMDGSIHAGLAAYNGGPGNAQRWIDETGLGDPDLYVEGIDYGETRSYVKLVYAQYDIYRRLYTAQ